jgi:hypothetical protein
MKLGRLKKSLALACLLLAACANAESARRGWSAEPAQWPSTTSPQPIVKGVGMQGPWTSVDKPDPPTSSTFEGGYSFKTGSTVTVQSVYMLTVNDDGSIKTREIKTTPVSVTKNEVVAGYHCASFTTEKVSFKEGDFFVVVLKAGGQTIPMFLKITYCRFLPS